MLSYFLICFYFALLILDHTWIVLVVIWGWLGGGAGKVKNVYRFDDSYPQIMTNTLILDWKEIIFLLKKQSIFTWGLCPSLLNFCLFFPRPHCRVRLGCHPLGSPMGVVENVVGLVSQSHQVEKWKQSGSSVFKSRGSHLRTHTAGFPQPWDVPWGCGKALLRVFEVL